MSTWSELPGGFLRMKFKSWSRLSREVRILIVDLAREQKFRCAHCDTTQGLEIDHDHDPEHGPGDEYTIYNIRGLVCRRCNWHIGMFEKKERGEWCNWPDVFQYIDYHGYCSAYESRTWPLIQVVLKQKLGISNYWRRRNLLGKFDDWREWGGRYPWHWGFDEIKDKKYGPIRTPKQFLGHLKAALQFVADEVKKNPNYRPPEVFFKVMERLEPIMTTIVAVAEERRKRSANANSAAGVP